MRRNWATIDVANSLGDRCDRPVCREGAGQPRLLPEQALWGRLNLRVRPKIIPQGQPYGDVKADSDRKTDDQCVHPVTVAARSPQVQSSLSLLLTIHRTQSLGYCATIRDSAGDRAMHATDDLKIGKWYRLSFPGIAARVIEPPASLERTSEYCFLVESLVLRSRWWVNGRGEPDNIYSPHLMVPALQAALREAPPRALPAA